MTTLMFKTNINCDGCKAKVKPLLDNIATVQQWNVDTTNPEKILSVSGEYIDAQAIVASVAKFGFKAVQVL